MRRDADFNDARCALVAFLYGSGRRAAAEGEWETLQQSQGTFVAQCFNLQRRMQLSRNWHARIPMLKPSEWTHLLP